MINKWVKVWVVIGLFASLSLWAYLSFFHIKECSTFECFQKSMEKCEKIEYINEDLEASWKYEVKGVEGSLCNVKVSLVNAKKGDLSLNEIIGNDMNCYYSKGTSAYPEKDLNKCTGKLKEELQGIIIKKLHSYILQNLGEINNSLQKN